MCIYNNNNNNIYIYIILKTLKRPERLLSLGSLDLLSIVPSLLESHEPQTQRLTVFAEDESTEHADF